MINFSKLGNDCQVPPSTVNEYVGLLEDTLIGFMLPAWTGSRKRKAIANENVFEALYWEPFLKDLWSDKIIWKPEVKSQNSECRTSSQTTVVIPEKTCPLEDGIEDPGKAFC